MNRKTPHILRACHFGRPTPFAKARESFSLAAKKIVRFSIRALGSNQARVIAGSCRRLYRGREHGA